ncbi:MAG: hypothetical protein ACLUIQ_03910 [Dialister invisus]
MELTANRADCFSMIGMALEVGAVFKRKVTLPSINVAESGMPIQGVLLYIFLMLDIVNVFADV